MMRIKLTMHSIEISSWPKCERLDVLCRGIPLSRAARLSAGTLNHGTCQQETGKIPQYGPEASAQTILDEETKTEKIGSAAERASRLRSGKHDRAVDFQYPTTFASRLLECGNCS